MVPRVPDRQPHHLAELQPSSLRLPLEPVELVGVEAHADVRATRTGAGAHDSPRSIARTASARGAGCNFWITR